MISLDFTDLVLVFGLMAIAIGLSVSGRLGLEGKLITSAWRAFSQLAIMGYVLAIVFDPRANHPILVIGLILAMITLVAIVTRNRISRKVPRLLLWVWVSLFISTLAIALYLILIIIQPPQATTPQYLIPIVGGILASTMNAVMVAGDHLVRTLNTHQIEIETHLSLGATPQQAIISYRRDAIRAGLAPTLNSMAIVGAVTLPGILTGQLLAGISPLDAVSYQILILFAIVLANLLGTIILTTAIGRQFFNSLLQLQHY